MNTIEPKGVTALQSRHCTVGQRDGLSEEDVQKINAHYRCRNAGAYTLFIVCEADLYILMLLVS